MADRPNHEHTPNAGEPSDTPIPLFAERVSTAVYADLNDSAQSDSAQSDSAHEDAAHGDSGTKTPTVLQASW